jgi:signal transduction histidine kinase
MTHPTPGRLGLPAGLTADVACAAARAGPLAQMLQLCAAALVRHLPASLARVWTLNATGDVLVHQATAGHGPPPDAAAAVPVGDSALGRVVRQRRPVLADDVPADPALADVGRPRATAFAGYPLVVDGVPIGALAVLAAGPAADGPLADLAPVVNLIAVGAERKRLEDRLRQAERLAAVGRLAGGVAHDLNNLLMVITGYGDLVRPHLPADSPALGTVAEIDHAAGRAAGLARRLLTVGRPNRPAPGALDVNAVVTGLEHFLGQLLRPDTALVLRLDPRAGRVRADAGELEQVLINLAGNAGDAMPRGGRLTVETAAAEVTDEDAWARPQARPGRYVRLAVADTGAGMDAAARARVFEPFFTTKGPGRGTGLGLATVWEIVRQTGGHVAVSREPGRGTTFQLYLPRADDPAPAATDLAQPVRVAP